MEQVYRTLMKLEATSSRKEKEKILKEEGSDQLKEVLYAALNPFITYGVKNIKSPVPVDVDLPLEDFGLNEWGLLVSLRERRLTGKAARDAIDLALSRLKVESEAVLIRILNKDLRAGIDASTVNKVFPGLIPSFSCMLAEPFDENRVRSWPVLVQPKLDGVRTLVLVNTATQEVEFLSRSGKPLPALTSLTEAVLDAAQRNQLALKLGGRQFVLDGEAVAGDFLKTVGDVRKKGKASEDVVLTVFDALPGAYFAGSTVDRAKTSYRTSIVEGTRSACGRVVPIASRMCSSADEVYAVYSEIRANGGEGVIVKDMAAAYEMRRSYAWMKIKDCQSLEAKVVGVERGTGRLSNAAGAIVVDVDGVQVKVGSGLTDGLREEIWGTFVTQPGRILGRLAEIEYHEKTSYGSLRHPRFVKFRDVLSGEYE